MKPFSSIRTPRVVNRCSAVGKPWRRHCLRVLGLGLLAAALGLGAPVVRAELPAPDNVLYGTIAIGGQLVTPDQPGVVVEARRTAGGAPVATGTVGAGNFYVLRIPLEAFAPLVHPDASLVGDTLFIVARNSVGVIGQSTYRVPEPGQSSRIDFGTLATDIDKDGLPDAWEQAWLGGLSFGGQTDEDEDGASNLHEYLAGTNPVDGDDFFRLEATFDPPTASVSFFALQAAGVGYEGRVRRYSLESTADLVLGTWTPVPGFTNISAVNQPVVYTISNTATQPVFYRGKIMLE